MTSSPPPPPDSPSDPRLPDAVARVAASVVAVVTRRRAASGVVWRPGLVVTSASALWHAPRAQVVLPGGEAVVGTLRGADPGTDLAVLEIAGGEGPAAGPAAGDVATAPSGGARAASSGSSATAAPDSVTTAASGGSDAAPAAPGTRVGDFVFAAGRDPEGGVHASFGHVGATGGAWRSWRGGRFDALIRLDGGLYPGLAGAAVAGVQSPVLGIASPAFSRHHAVVVPAATIERVLAALLAHGRVPRSHLGIAVQPVRATLDGAATEGLLVSSVAEGGPAAAGGLLVGDVIVEAAGRPARELEALRATIADTTPGAALALTVSRAGRRVTLAIDVAEQPRTGCH
ncbi:MAG: serine protease [Burkholderiales bacterium]|nr:serine protease [Burkholderiales bacterium]